jgi:hypothetical protein
MQDKKSICDKVIKLDRNIRFAGLVNERGEVIQGGFQQGVQPLLESVDEQQMYIQSLSYVSSLALYKEKLGAVRFCVTEHDKVNLLTFPLDDGSILCISSNPKSSAEKLKAKVYRLLKNSRKQKTGMQSPKRVSNRKHYQKG